jgi:outer membrane protein assembly factor BamB
MRVRPAVVALVLVAVAAAAPAAVTPANVARLGVKWDVPLDAVTGALVMSEGTLYVTSWDGNVYAMDPLTGVPRWTFDAGGLIGLPGGVVATGDGRVCFGTTSAEVFCVHTADGSLDWQRTVGTLGDAVWSPPAIANGRLYVSVASLADQPCVPGRLVVLDLATGDPAWSLQTVPDAVCSTDTGVACTTDADCGGAPCVAARGGGVTATVSFDPTGAWVYMNTVGCYTFPSVGDSDSIFKLNAETGAVVWKTRVTPPEQFGFCAADAAVECSTDAHCAGAGGACTLPKPNYHDFGFLNGPIPIGVPPGGGAGILVSGSKDGTLYALHESTGQIAWTNEVQPVPVSPGFAGYGLFNGALAVVDGRIHAALNQLIPSRVCADDHRTGCTSDAGCSTGICLPRPEHLAAFSPTDGSLLWSDEIGPSWSSVAVGNGIVYAGTNVDTDPSGASEFYAYDAAGGTRLATFALPASSTARAAVGDDAVYVGYGVFGAGGVRALALCGNGLPDPGEVCDPADPAAGGCCTAACQLAAGGTPCADDANGCTDDACDAAGQCRHAPNAAACDDADACTAGDVCAAGTCAGQVTGTDGVGCVLGRIDDAPCGDTPLPRSLARAVDRALASMDRLLARAARAAERGRTAKVEKLRKGVLHVLDGIAKRAAKSARSRNPQRRIDAACRAAIDDLTGRSRTLVETFAF